jgi:hypothetical protein
VAGAFKRQVLRLGDVREKYGTPLAVLTSPRRDGPEKRGYRDHRQYPGDWAGGAEGVELVSSRPSATGQQHLPRKPVRNREMSKALLGQTHHRERGAQSRPGAVQQAVRADIAPGRPGADGAINTQLVRRIVDLNSGGAAPVSALH